MTIIKEFTKDMTLQEVKDWYYECATREKAFRDLICHFETKLENMQKEINYLRYGENKLAPKQEGFKVGWVYKTQNGERILIIENDIDVPDKEQHCKSYTKEHFPIRGITIPEIGLRSFTLKGHKYIDDPYNYENLDHSTGKKWEMEE